VAEAPPSEGLAVEASPLVLLLLPRCF
jgi:hypothetical protein